MIFRDGPSINGKSEELSLLGPTFIAGFDLFMKSVLSARPVSTNSNRTDFVSMDAGEFFRAQARHYIVSTKDDTGNYHTGK